MQFTPAVQVIYALNQALDEFFEETPAGRFKRYHESWNTLKGGLEKLGFNILLPVEQHAGLISSVHEPADESYSFESMHDYLYKKGYTIYPGKISGMNTFRIANIGAIDKIDIENFLTELNNYLKVNNILV